MTNNLTLKRPVFLFHSCPRCNGKLYYEQDSVGGYESCLNCGYSKDLEPLTKKEQTDWQGLLIDLSTKPYKESQLK